MAFLLKNMKDYELVITFHKGSGVEHIRLPAKGEVNLSAILSESDITASSGVLSHNKNQGLVSWEVKEVAKVAAPVPPPSVPTPVVSQTEAPTLVEEKSVPRRGGRAPKPT